MTVMNKGVMRGTKKMYTSLAAISIVMLLAATVVTPSSAFASSGKDRDHGENGNHNVTFTLFDNHNNGGKGNVQNNGNVLTGHHDDDDRKTNDKKEDQKEKDKKEDNKHDHDKCKPNKHGKYSKDCREDQGGH